MTDRLDSQLRALAVALVDEAPEPPAFHDVELELRPSCTPRRRAMALIVAACVVLAAVAVIAVLNTGDDGGAPASSPGSWPAFCRVATEFTHTENYAYAPGQWGNPKLAALHRKLVAAAPAGRFRDTMRLADPHLPVGPTPPRRIIQAMRTVNKALIQHCGLDTSIFGIIVGPTAS
jgi:hypothetical protein